MSEKFAYFRGCVADQSAKENDIATTAVCRKLGIELVDMPFHCCGGGLMHEVADKEFTSLNAYNLDIARNENLEILTICSVCNFSLKLSAKRGNEETVRIRSLEEVVIQEIGLENLKILTSERVEGMKVAPFYGCKSLRPGEFNPFNDSTDPDHLERFISSLGAVPVKYPFSKKCCGFPDLYVDKEVAVSINNQVLNSANENGAELVITPCPLCQLTLDIYQSGNLKLPVLHFSQFLGLALGIPPKDLGMNMNLTSVKALRV